MLKYNERKKKKKYINTSLTIAISYLKTNDLILIIKMTKYRGKTERINH